MSDGIKQINNRNKQIKNAIVAASMSYSLACIAYMSAHQRDHNFSTDPAVAVAAFHDTLNQFLAPLELDQSALLAAFSAAQTQLRSLRESH